MVRKKSGTGRYIGAAEKTGGYGRSAGKVALDRLEPDGTSRELGDREYADEVDDAVEAVERFCSPTAGSAPKTPKKAVRKSRPRRSATIDGRNSPVTRLALLGLFSPEAVDLAVKAITKTVERAVTAEAPGDAAERNYLAAAKTVLEYEVGKPRQRLEVTGKDGGAIETKTTTLDVSRLTDEELKFLERITREENRSGEDTS